MAQDCSTSSFTTIVGRKRVPRGMFVASVLMVACTVLAACSMPVNTGRFFPGGGDDETPVAVTATNTVAFEPLVGLPTEIGQAMATQLGNEAVARSLQILPQGDPTAAVQATGTFDAQKSGDETIVTYVWELKDGSGNRKSQFGGEQRIANRSKDPWAAVGDQQIGAMASRIIDEIIIVMGRLPSER